MLPESVSPRFVRRVSNLVTYFVFPVTFLERAWIHILALHGDRPVGDLDAPEQRFFYFGVREALSYLGIRVRSRSVERFRAARRDDRTAAGELPRRITHGQWLSRILSVHIVLVGVMLALFTWGRPPSRPTADAWLGLVVAVIGLLMGRFRLGAIHETSDEGIRAPEHPSGRLTFVPWGELIRCEIIRDEEDGRYESFALWDRSGRCRIKGGAWIGSVNAEEVAHVIHVLRSRFPERAKPDETLELVAARSASSGMWDRELDG